MIVRADLHALLDEIPEERLPAVHAALVEAIAPYRPIEDAPEDDEPVTDDDLAAIREGREAYARGEYITDEELVRKMGW